MNYELIRPIQDRGRVMICSLNTDRMERQKICGTGTKDYLGQDRESAAEAGIFKEKLEYELWDR